ncbi:hypothetical protein EDB85DRAFT_2042422 [Lactarius pseudohatsudake]|nr:hypothetical protein EDB85DRAFT_2042422 [Lactarius pseudohatsudake]
MRAVGMRGHFILGLVTGSHTHVVRVHQRFVLEEDRVQGGVGGIIGIRNFIPPQPITFHSPAVPPCTPRPDPQTGIGGV